nr:uncharacterized conserved protein (DUF2039) [Coptotermes formosanus]
MSCQRGNVKRTRPQKYKNKTAFKNDLNDSSSKTKELNKMEIVNVCAKCKAILEWKIKYKKYKLPKAPKKCTMCEQKTIKNAYHIICIPCAEMQKVCPKCGKTEEIVKSNVPDQLKLDVEFQNFIKDLTERKRRTFLRCLSEKERLGGKVAKDLEKTKEEVLGKLNSLNLESEEEDFDEDDFDDFCDQSSSSEC